MNLNSSGSYLHWNHVVAPPSFASRATVAPHTGVGTRKRRQPRPAVGAEGAVREVLMSGNHAAIAAWRQGQAAAITQRRRPDLYARHVASSTATS